MREDREQLILKKGKLFFILFIRNVIGFSISKLYYKFM